MRLCGRRSPGAAPFSPARWRTIGIATLDPAGLTAVARTFVGFLTSPDNADLLQ